MPDAALVTMKYNNRDQLALEQDGNLLALNTHQAGTGTINNISQINYDWKNQVTEKNLGKTPSATNYFQSLDYAYNNQGRLTTINAASLGGTNTGLAACPAMPSPGAASTTPDLNDLFYLELKYDV